MTFTTTNLYNIYFVGVTTLVAVIGAPLYIYHYGIAASEIVLLVFYIMVTGLSVTTGYHRLFAHVTYKTNNVVRFLLLFFGAAAFQQSALAWSSQHRDHHRYVDTESDPYNIRKGFFWAHMGWLFFGKYRFYYANAGDLVDSKLVLHQARYYPIWSLTSGLVVPVMIGAWTGHALGAFVLSVCFRVVFVHHGSWCINSVCHTFGKASYDAGSSARDHWLVALITFGEGYHNFHHRFPNDYRNGVRWYHWDPSKWIISLFEKLGLAQSVKRASEFRILEARVKASGQAAIKKLERVPMNHAANSLRQRLEEQCKLLAACLSHWERAAKKHGALLAEPRSQHLLRVSSDEMAQARKTFFRVNRKWRRFTERQIHSLV